MRSLRKRVMSVLLVMCMVVMGMPQCIWAETVTEQQTVTGEQITAEEQNETLLDYVYIQEQELVQGLPQNLVVALKAQDTEITAAQLIFQYGNSQEVSLDMLREAENAMLFTMTPQETGTYTLLRVEYTLVSGVKASVKLDQDGSLPTFTVVEGEADEQEAELLSPEGSDIQELQADGAVNIETQELNPVASNGRVVVVLDPGHDSRHCGATGNGLREENVNLAIALHCKEELEKYNNVDVYMTRTDGSCLNTSSNGACMQARVNYAKSVGANLLVSIHVDASGTSSSTGSLAIVAGNSGYRDDLAAITQQAGSKIQAQLSALGLASRGLYIRWSDSAEEEYTYPNGVAADWYSITRNSIKAGIPGIIIEHGFITSYADVSKYLNSDEKLRSLGVADATGIAQYFGLTKGTDVYGTLVDTSTALYTQNTTDVAGFIANLYRTCLDRNPRRDEVSYWLSQVARNDLTGEQLACNFVWSQEFQNKGLNNSQFVEKLYHIYLGRSSDTKGKQYWVAKLNAGVSKNDVVRGFELSTEFHNTCSTYGIAQTGGTTQNAKLYTAVAEFVADYYRGFLNREPDAAGLEYWTTKLVNGGSAADLTKGFVFSQEFKNSNVNRSQFVECLYNTYLRRASEASGKQYWMNQLPSMTWSEKEVVIRGFLYSVEYKNRCTKYGIYVGSL